MSDLTISIQKFTDIPGSSYQYIFHCFNDSLSLYASLGLGLLQSIIRSQVYPDLKHIQLELERVIYKVKPVLDFKITGLIESLIEVISNTDEVRSTRMAWLFSYMTSNQGPPYSISLVLQEYINLKYKKELNESAFTKKKIIELICLEFKICVQVVKGEKNYELITAGQTGKLPILVIYQQLEVFSLLYEEEAAKFDSKDVQYGNPVFQPFTDINQERYKQVNIKSPFIPKYPSFVKDEKLQIPINKSPAHIRKISHSQSDADYLTAPSQEKLSNKIMNPPPSLNLFNALPGNLNPAFKCSEVKVINSLCATIVNWNNFEEIDCEYLNKIVAENLNQNEIKSIKSLINLIKTWREKHNKCESCSNYVEIDYFCREFVCSTQCKICNLCRAKDKSACIICNRRYSEYEIESLSVFKISVETP